MRAIVRSIRARGEDIVLEAAGGDVTARGIVGRGGDAEALGDANAVATQELTVTLAADDAAHVVRGATVALGGSRHLIRGIVRQGPVSLLMLRVEPEPEEDAA